MFSCGFGELSHLDMIIIIAARHFFQLFCLRVRLDGLVAFVSHGLQRWCLSAVGFDCFWLLMNRSHHAGDQFAGPCW